MLRSISRSPVEYITGPITLSLLAFASRTKRSLLEIKWTLRSALFSKVLHQPGRSLKEGDTRASPGARAQRHVDRHRLKLSQTHGKPPRRKQTPQIRLRYAISATGYRLPNRERCGYSGRLPELWRANALGVRSRNTLLTPPLELRCLRGLT